MASRGTTLIGARRPLTSARAGASAVSDRCAPVTEGGSGHIYLDNRRSASVRVPAREGFSISAIAPGSHRPRALCAQLL